MNFDDIIININNYYKNKYSSMNKGFEILWMYLFDILIRKNILFDIKIIIWKMF